MAASVSTTRRIALAQLAAEMGGVKLAMVDDGTARTITAALDQATLQAAVDAHVPEPDPADAERNRVTVEDAIGDALTSLRASMDTARTIAQKANADIGPRDTKDVARELVSTIRVTLRLCRHALGRYDGAE